MLVACDNTLEEMEIPKGFTTFGTIFAGNKVVQKIIIPEGVTEGDYGGSIFRMQ